jgi:hypothetical protein
MPTPNLALSPELTYPPLDVYRAKYEDTATWLAEVLDGQMRTEFSFVFDGNELISEDGRPVGKIFDDAIEEAEILAQNEPQLAFEPPRRRIERGEYRDTLSMMRGEQPNTMVTVSDFPAKLNYATEDVGGYNVRRRQTMLRVISRQADDTLLIQSQSLDGSYRYALEAIFDQLGQKPEPGELLGQRINLDLPNIWQTQLIDNLTAVYDKKLQQQMGGSWYAGRRPEDHLNTYDFVLAQDDLINAFMASAEPEDLRYGLAAAIEARFKKRSQKPLARALGFIRRNSNPELEMQLAAQEAARAGKTYSGCGLTQEAQALMEQQLKDAGYGNKSNEDKYGSLTFKCQKGHFNTRLRNKLIDKCKTCGISVKC